MGVDKHGEIVGVLAESLKKVSELVWEVTLKSGTKFSDGTDVTSAAVAAALQELNDKNSNAQSSLGKMTVTAPSATTVRIESERETHVMDSVLAEYAFTIFYKNGNEFVFTGPYKVEEFVQDSHIKMSPNEHYHDGKAGERPSHLTVKKYSTGDALAEALKAGEIDVAFHLPITSLAEINKLDGILVKTFETGYHYMAHYNIHNSTNDAMADKNVRKAIDLAINRAELVEELAGGKGTRSFFPDYTPWYAQHGSDTAAVTEAETLLDGAGWTLENGKRTKNGQVLTVRAVAYPQRPGLPIILPKVAEQLEALGITVNQIVTSGKSWDELDAIMATRSWDMLFWAQNTLPAGDPLHFLSKFFRCDSAGNIAKYCSASTDALLDTLSLKDDHTERVAASKAAMAAIIADSPTSNLVTPGWHVGLSELMKEYEPYGSDYYIINADTHEVGKMSESTTAPDSGGSVFVAAGVATFGASALAMFA